jgi:hypothetical protein
MRHEGGKFGVSSKEDRTYRGRVYHSKREARHAAELDLRIKVGEVESWTPQVRIPLFGKSGKKVATYVADFEVRLKDGSIVYEETKGMETEAWRIKARWLKADYPGMTLRTVR